MHSKMHQLMILILPYAGYDRASLTLCQHLECMSSLLKCHLGSCQLGHYMLLIRPHTIMQDTWHLSCLANYICKLHGEDMAKLVS